MSASAEFPEFRPTQPPFRQSASRSKRRDRQGVGATFKLWNQYLGDQWSIGDWDGLVAAAPSVLPPPMLDRYVPGGEPPQNLKEYDPEWGRAFVQGTVAQSCDHEAMLRQVKVPVLFTHHFRRVDADSGQLFGALSDLQAERAKVLLAQAGVAVDYRSFERMGHSMHGEDPQLFTETVVDWVSSLSG